LKEARKTPITAVSIAVANLVKTTNYLTYLSIQKKACDMICVYELIIAKQNKKEEEEDAFYTEDLHRNTKSVIQLQPQLFKAVKAVHNMK